MSHQQQVRLPPLEARAALSKVLLQRARIPKPPPPGFDPLSAADEHLFAHGLPQRPDKAAFPREYAAWEQVLSRRLAFVAPSFQIMEEDSNAAPEPAPEEHQGKTWSGAVLKDPPEDTSFCAIRASWTVTRAYPRNSAWEEWGWNNSRYKAGTWIGLDGYHYKEDKSRDVLQAGTAERCVVSTHQTIKQPTLAWFEWFPMAPVWFSNLEVQPGDLVDCFIYGPNFLGDNNSFREALIIFINRSACTYSSVFLPEPDDADFKGDTAEWIIEGHDRGKSLPYLGATTFRECTAIAVTPTKSHKYLDLTGATLLDLVVDGVVVSRPVIENPKVLSILGEDRDVRLTRQSGVSDMPPNVAG